VVLAVDRLGDRLGVRTGIALPRLRRASRLVALLTAVPVPAGRAVVGAQAAPPEIIGEPSDRTVRRGASRSAFVAALDAAGLRLPSGAVDAAYRRFGELTERKAQLSDADLLALATEEDWAVTPSGRVPGWSFQWLALAGGTGTPPRAVVRLARGTGGRGELVEAEGHGDGMIDAVCDAVARAAGVRARLVGFTVAAVTPGSDAVADVAVDVDVAGRRISARGVSTDVVEATARAFLHALNRAERALVAP
jgi:2-isopropylmalate synthase